MEVIVLNQDPQKKRQILFETICQLAKDKNEAELSKLVKSGVCIDLLQNETTPVMFLAEEGDFLSVKFLIKKFQASINFALRGYSAGGYIEQVEDLISRGASLNYAAEGYAIAGNKKEVENLLAQGASLNITVHGYACGGHHKQVKKLLERGASLNYALRGYAMTDQVEQVDNLLKQRPLLMRHAAWAYARSGNVKQVENLIEHGVELEFPIIGYACSGYKSQVKDLIARGGKLVHAAIGYAIGGHSDLVEDLISRGVSLDDVVQAYARGGHVAQVENLIARGANLENAARGYARGGHAEQVEDLIARGVNLSVVVEEYARGGHADKVKEMISRGGSPRDAAYGYAVGGHVELLLQLEKANKDSASSQFIDGMVELAKVVNITVGEQSEGTEKRAQALPMACIISEVEIGKLTPNELLNQLDEIGILDVYVLLNSNEYLLAQTKRWQPFDDYPLLTFLEQCQLHRKDSRLKFHLVNTGSTSTEEEKLNYYLKNVNEQYLMNLFLCKNPIPWVTQELSTKLDVVVKTQIYYLPFISFETRNLPSLEKSRSSKKAIELLQRPVNPCLCFQKDSLIDHYHYRWLFNIFIELVTLEIEKKGAKNSVKVKERMNKLIQDYAENIKNLERAEKKFIKTHKAFYRESKEPSYWTKKQYKNSVLKKERYERKFTEIIIEMANIYQKIALQSQHQKKSGKIEDSYGRMGDVIKYSALNSAKEPSTKIKTTKIDKKKKTESEIEENPSILKGPGYM